MLNPSVQRTGASRWDHNEPVSPRRLAPTADAGRSASSRTQMTTTLKHHTRSDFSRFVVHFTTEAAPFGWVCVGAVVLLLTAAANPLSAAESKKPKTSIPKIANIAGIKVGYSSMEELEARLGKGKVMVGGHPNGARLWRVKGTSWVIHADAFDYSERGVVLDSFDITVDPKLDRGVPYARLAKNDIAWVGKISLGMDEEKLLKLVKSNSWRATQDADGWLVEAKGYSPLTSVPIWPFQEWTARFEIKEKSLTGMWLDARQRRESK
jgi:hypothetical protein